MQISRQQKGLQEFLSWSCEERLEEARVRASQEVTHVMPGASLAGAGVATLYFVFVELNQTKPRGCVNPQGSGRISAESSKQPASNTSDKLSQPAVPVRVPSSHWLAEFPQ